MFDALNCGKRSVTLNLKHPEGHALAKRLVVEWADAVGENFAPRAMRGLGLAYDDLVDDKPDLVMVSACLNGQTGPHRDYPGFGGQGAALSGLQLPDRLARPRADRSVRHHHRLAGTPLRRHRAWPPRCCTIARPATACTSISARSSARRGRCPTGCSPTGGTASSANGAATPIRMRGCTALFRVRGRRSMGRHRGVDGRRAARLHAITGDDVEAWTATRDPLAVATRAAGRGHRSRTRPGLRRPERRPATRGTAATSSR